MKTTRTKGRPIPPVSAAIAFLVTSLLGGALPAVEPGRKGKGAPAEPQEAGLHVIPGTFSPTNGPDGNTVVLHGPEGLVVVDAGRHPAHSRKILDHAEAAGRPIVAVINTHWHLDHTTGNRDLKHAHPGSVLYATRAVEGALAGFLEEGAARTEEALKGSDLTGDDRARMERGVRAVREPDALLPDVPVVTRTSVELGGRVLELNVTNRAVTESDLWVWDAATRTVIAGDLVTLPVPLFDTGCPIGWRAALEAIAAKPFDQLIPGHGFIMDRGEFQAYLTAFENLVACAEENEGRVCAQRWMDDADALLSKAAGEDYADRDYARAAATYYVDRILRDEAKRGAFCGEGSAGAAPSGTAPAP